MRKTAISLVQMEIGSYVDKTFIDGIHVDIFRGNHLQIYAINLSGYIDIMLHSGHGGDVAHMGGNFKQAAAVAYPQRFHGRGNGKTERAFSS